jgi:hypothetical protein
MGLGQLPHKFSWEQSLVRHAELVDHRARSGHQDKYRVLWPASTLIQSIRAVLNSLKTTSVGVKEALFRSRSQKIYPTSYRVNMGPNKKLRISKI